MLVKVSLRNFITSSFQINWYSVLVVQKNFGFSLRFIGITIRNLDPLSVYVQETLETDGIEIIPESCSVSLHTNISSVCDDSSKELVMLKLSKVTA